MGVVAAGSLAACNQEPTVGPADIEAPPASRIGNVATADIDPVGGSGIAGTVTFVPLAETLRIEASVTGLSGGAHGLHLHEVGDCSAPDASSAGGHFAPDGDPHGAADPPAQHHAGDLGNLVADANGNAEITREDAELTLVGDYGVVGKAVVIHREGDDLRSQPSGDAGERVACGVIEWGSASLIDNEEETDDNGE